MLVYVDTNIVLDALLDRDNRSGRDLGTAAMSLFSQAKNCRFDIVVSDWMKKEASAHIESDTVEQLLDRLDHKIVNISYEDGDIRRAKDLSDEPDDALHAVLADNAGADVIATRNTTHFRPTDHLVPARHPSHIG